MSKEGGGAGPAKSWAFSLKSPPRLPEKFKYKQLIQIYFTDIGVLFCSVFCLDDLGRQAALRMLPGSQPVVLCIKF